MTWELEDLIENGVIALLGTRPALTGIPIRAYQDNSPAAAAAKLVVHAKPAKPLEANGPRNMVAIEILGVTHIPGDRDAANNRTLYNQARALIQELRQSPSTLTNQISSATLVVDGVVPTPGDDGTTDDRKFIKVATADCFCTYNPV